MTSKNALHALVNELPDSQADLAFELLEDLRDAADLGGHPLKPRLSLRLIGAWKIFGPVAPSVSNSMIVTGTCDLWRQNL